MKAEKYFLSWRTTFCGFKKLAISEYKTVCQHWTSFFAKRLLCPYDIIGKEVKRIAGNYPAGKHQIEWAGDDSNGVALSAGLYHIRVAAAENVQGVKVVLAR